MPNPAATTWEELFNFEEAFEDAALAVITAADIPALKAREDEEKPELGVAVRFTLGPASGSKQIVTREAVARQEYDRYQGCTLEVEVTASRPFDEGSEIDGVDTKLAEVRAKLRNLFRESLWPFNDTNLPFYRVSRLMPAGAENGLIAETMQDTSILRWTLDFGIQPTAWPAG